MFVKDIINIDIKAIQDDCSLQDAKRLFYIHKVSDLAVINESQEYIGLLKEETVLDLLEDNNVTTIKNIKLEPLSITLEQHVYEVFETLTTHSLSLIPIVNKSNNYIGVITVNNLINYISTITSFKHKGAIIILLIQQKDYSLTQICQIIENNGAKIISLFSNFINETTIEITLKVNIEEISSILQSFDRYNYHTKTLNAQTEVLDDLLQSRIENLMNFINV